MMTLAQRHQDGIGVQQGEKKSKYKPNSTRKGIFQPYCIKGVQCIFKGHCALVNGRGSPI